MADLLNIGCGSTRHPDWTNLDMGGGDVMQHNVYDGLPFDAESFDVVYSAHLLEHLYKRFVPLFLQECKRVLKTGGIIRLVVPDLEEIVRQYRINLALIEQGHPEGHERYEWSVIELLDQLCRHRSGGEMLEYWKHCPVEGYVAWRCGEEATQAIQRLHQNGHKPLGAVGEPLATERDPKSVGEFRLSGQAHLWMYDGYSLRKLMQEAGFQCVHQRGFDESAIPHFSDYCLDRTEDGRIRKPDSIYFEGRK